ncbi:MAG TPA: NUDIX hydrolase [Deltaproteobacteria bacterium]|nr:NUDIX hydrolase [Deltaproteobacteria bacterium]HCP46259.1 NUDIX hydrolase [Deltaproteobacteria bacterium]|tara:strand:- start:1414 stop:2010 length:597 start_codon:yes stop_codon:yes gene_type:complete
MVHLGTANDPPAEQAHSRRQRLAQVLHGHKPRDDRERRHKARMLELVNAHSHCCSRSLWEPGHFTASAFVLSPEGDRLLLIFHKKLKLWLQPGGHIDPQDQDIEAAARREVREETGLVTLQRLSGPGTLLDLDIHPIPAHPKRDEPAHEHFDMRILFRAGSEELRPGDDAADARWVPLGDVEKSGTDESVQRALSKLC